MSGQQLRFRTGSWASRCEKTIAVWGVVEKDNMGLFKASTNIFSIF